MHTRKYRVKPSSTLWIVRDCTDRLLRIMLSSLRTDVHAFHFLYGVCAHYMLFCVSRQEKIVKHHLQNRREIVYN